jgi:hypothetical protein
LFSCLCGTNKVVERTYVIYLVQRGRIFVFWGYFDLGRHFTPKKFSRWISLYFIASVDFHF